MKILLDKTKEKAAVLVELSLIIPVIIVITFASIEISNTIEKWMFAQTLSKEFAYTITRDCSNAMVTSSRDELKIETCMQRLKTSFDNIMNNLNSSYSITLIRKETDSADFNYTIDNNGPLGLISQADYQDLLLLKDVVIISEVQIPYQPIINLGRLLNRQVFQRDTVNDVSIF